MALMDLIVMKSRSTITDSKRLLETEESGKIIATLQGKLSGAKLFLSVINNNYTTRNFTLESIDEEGKTFELRSFDNHSVAALEQERLNLEADHAWDHVEEILEKATREKQIWLFYTAEKGRDLDYCHGWRDAMNEYRGITGYVAGEYKTRLRQNPLFAEEFGLIGYKK